MMINDPVFNAFYPAAQSATSVDQVKQILQQANLYVAQQFWCTCLAGPYAYCLTQPWVKGCSGATPLGPITYYGDWIDQGLKKLCTIEQIKMEGEVDCARDNTPA